MNLLSYQDVENYLQNKQVYFKMEIVNADFKTIAKCSMVHNVGMVELTRLNQEQIAFAININGTDTTMYQHMSDKELFKWIQTNFIPVYKLVERWSS